MTSGVTERPKRSECHIAKRYFSIFTKGDLDEYLDKFEAHMEKELITTLRNVGIQATVKRDKFSLPYEHEKTMQLRLESFLNAVVDYRWAFRIFVKELLDKDVNRIRFYLWTDLFEDDNARRRCQTGIRYHFRYYIHDR